MNGFLVINKPVGITTYDVIRHIKRIIGKHKIGHSGTLDPFASGVVIIGIGRSYTKQLHTIIQASKEYLATIVLGKTTNTYDIDGEVTNTYPSTIHFCDADILSSIQPFIGEIEQQPPVFSAKKINGVPAYKLARKGVEVQLKPANVTVHSIKLIEYKNTPKPMVRIQVKCSSGTYIRSLAHDIGQNLGVGAYLSDLNRISVGNISLEHAIPLSDLTSETIAKACRLTLPK